MENALRCLSSVLRILRIYYWDICDILKLKYGRIKKCLVFEIRFTSLS